MTKSEDVETESTWGADLVRRFGAAAKAARGSRSANWLSVRTEELGRKVSPTVIAKLDSGHRGEVLQLAEVIVLAAALDVPPLQLIYPDLPDGPVEVLPKRVEPSISAVSWFEGAGMGSRIARSRQYETMRREVADFETQLAEMASTLEGADGDETFPKYMAAVRNLKARADDMKADMREKGWPVDD